MFKKHFTKIIALLAFIALTAMVFRSFGMQNLGRSGMRVARSGAATALRPVTRVPRVIPSGAPMAAPRSMPVAQPVAHSVESEDEICELEDRPSMPVRMALPAPAQPGGVVGKVQQMMESPIPVMAQIPLAQPEFIEDAPEIAQTVQTTEPVADVTAVPADVDDMPDLEDDPWISPDEAPAQQIEEQDVQPVKAEEQTADQIMYDVVPFGDRRIPQEIVEPIPAMGSIPAPEPEILTPEVVMPEAMQAVPVERQEVVVDAPCKVIEGEVQLTPEMAIVHEDASVDTIERNVTPTAATNVADVVEPFVDPVDQLPAQEVVPVDEAPVIYEDVALDVEQPQEEIEYGVAPQSDAGELGVLHEDAALENMVVGDATTTPVVAELHTAASDEEKKVGPQVGKSSSPSASTEKLRADPIKPYDAEQLKRKRTDLNQSWQQQRARQEAVKKKRLDAARKQARKQRAKIGKAAKQRRAEDARKNNKKAQLPVNVIRSHQELPKPRTIKKLKNNGSSQLYPILSTPEQPRLIAVETIPVKDTATERQTHLFDVATPERATHVEYRDIDPAIKAELENKRYAHRTVSEPQRVRKHPARQADVARHQQLLEQGAKLLRSRVAELNPPAEIRRSTVPETMPSSVLHRGRSPIMPRGIRGVMRPEAAPVAVTVPAAITAATVAPEIGTVDTKPHTLKPVNPPERIIPHETEDPEIHEPTPVIEPEPVIPEPEIPERVEPAVPEPTTPALTPVRAPKAPKKKAGNLRKWILIDGNNAYSERFHKQSHKPSQVEAHMYEVELSPRMKKIVTEFVRLYNTGNLQSDVKNLKRNDYSKFLAAFRQALRSK